MSENPLNLADPSLLRQKCLIDGAWVDAASGATLAVDDPATGLKIGNVPDMGREETAEAIVAANRAFKASQ